MARRLDHRRIKKHRSYTVAEIAACLGVSRETARRWIKNGLPAVTDRKPMLVLGEDLIEFLTARKKPRQKCALGECYCLSCRAPRAAAGGMADLHVDTTSTGNLSALCVVCMKVMRKRVSVARLPELRTILDVILVQVRQPISNRASACSNDHFAKERETHA